MNAARLIEHFDRVSEAPDAVPRLRQLLLKLAASGRLVAQSSDDQAATDDLRRARKSLAARAIGTTRLRWKPSDALNPTETAIELPTGWVLARLNDTGLFINGLPFKPSDWHDAGLPIIRIQNLSDPSKSFNYARGEFPDEVLVRTGDVLVSWSATLDAFVWDREPGVLNQHIFRVIPASELVDTRFLTLLLKQAIRDLAESEHAHGLVMAHINRGPFLSHIVAIPPRAEQHRIVAKVDELMALCDRLETAQAERERRRDRLVEGSLARLNQPSNDASFREGARFDLANISRLTARTGHITALRETVLSLAVRGGLVRPDEGDGSLSAQLALSDQARKAKAAVDRRADEDVQTLLAGDDRWQIPIGWTWRALADLVLFIDYRGQTPAKTERGVRLITAKNVKKGFISHFPEEFLSESNYPTWMTRGIPTVGDVLFTTEAPMGNAAVVKSADRFALAQRVICFRSYGAMNPDFLVLQLLARPFREILEKTATGLTAKGIKAAKLKRLPIAVPPLEEQGRIVSRVEALMAICDRLDAQLSSAQADSRYLLDAILHEVATADRGLAGQGNVA